MGKTWKPNIKSKRLEEFIKFGIVGGSGVLVNMGLLFVLTRFLSVRLEIASIIAIETSILSNFFLNNLWTFKKRNTHVPFWVRLFRYHLVTGLAGIVNYLVLLLLVKTFGWHDMLSNLIGIAIGTIINYSLNSLWTWRVRSS
jgi:dolichol-phosphate mannosyltransferase